MKTRFILLSLLLCISGKVTSQDGYTIKQDSLKSEILSQNRKLDIYLPEGYDTSAAKFPVIYVLDADGRDQHTVPTARFLFLNSKMPKVIVVGVKNIDRNHDFLPDSSKGTPTGGGADKFIQFFKNELIPYVDKNYKSEPYKVIVGHSFGGLFAMYALLNDPGLFEAYIAIDPSFWYKDQMVVKSAQAELMKARNWKRPLFITGREGEGLKEMGITSMEKLLKVYAPADLKWSIVAYPDEDHGSVPFKSVYDGLRYIFDAGSNFMVYPETGIIPAGRSAYAFILNNNSNLRFTVDGTEPNINSPKCKTAIKLPGPCTLKVKSVAEKYKNKPAITRIYTKGEFIKGEESAVNLKHGLKYSYYEGVWDSLPDFSKLSPVKTGITDNIDLNMALKRDSFAVRFEGYLHITKKNLYYIWIVSDDGSKVYLNDKLILSNDGLHSPQEPKVTVMPLEAGYYPVVIQYFEKNSGESLSLGAFSGKDITSPIPIPKELLFYKE
jgi:predicted alpha/beta superfamily hydrolase